MSQQGLRSINEEWWCHLFGRTDILIAKVAIDSDSSRLGFVKFKLFFQSRKTRRIELVQNLSKPGKDYRKAEFSLHQEESPKKDLPIVGGKNPKLIVVDRSQKPNLIQKKRTNRNVSALHHYSFPTLRILTLLVSFFFLCTLLR